MIEGWLVGLALVITAAIVHQRPESCASEEIFLIDVISQCSSATGNRAAPRCAPTCMTYAPPNAPVRMIRIASCCEFHLIDAGLT